MAQAKLRSPRQHNKSIHLSPRNDDSPSRQLQFELERAFSQVHLHDNERQKLYAFHRRSLQEELDAKELALAALHKTEHEIATAKHEIVRQQAEAVLEEHVRAEEERRRQKEAEERRRKEEELRRKAEEQRQLKEAAERKAREEQQRAEAAKKAAEQKVRAETEERERKQREMTAQKEREEKEKAEQEALKQREAREKAAKEKALSERVNAEQADQAAKATSSQARPHDLSETERRHRDYLAIHKNLKAFRKSFWEEAKKDPSLKPVVGDMRRAMRTSVGQLTDDRVGNRKATERVKGVILKALNEIPSRPVILNQWLPSHLTLLDKNTTTIPSLVLYLISIFSKAIVNSFVGECAVNTKAAEPIGTLVAQIFSLPELQFSRNAPSINSGIHYEAFGGTVPTPPMKPTSVSLITILICKFHAVTPILFGISGPENTASGRSRLGWRRDYARDGDSQKSFVVEQKQYDRLIGLGAGYASIATRNFSKAKITNPFPPVHFWQSLAFIINTEPKDVQTSHLILLRSMLENSLDRFILFFGAAGVAVIREALVEFPKRLSADIAQKPAAKALVLLADSFKKEKHFNLT